MNKSLAFKIILNILINLLIIIWINQEVVQLRINNQKINKHNFKTNFLLLINIIPGISNHL